MCNVKKRNNCASFEHEPKIKNKLKVIHRYWVWENVKENKVKERHKECVNYNEARIKSINDYK